MVEAVLLFNDLCLMLEEGGWKKKMILTIRAVDSGCSKAGSSINLHLFFRHHRRHHNRRRRRRLRPSRRRRRVGG